MIVYNFSQTDLEDNLPRERGLLTVPDRFSILKTSVQFGFLLFGGFLVLLQTLLEPERWLPAFGALVLVVFLGKFFGGWSISGVSEGLRLFLVRSLVSLGAMVSALLMLLLGARTRIQPLRTPVRVFCWVFVALLAMDVLFGTHVGLPTAIHALSWNPFRETLLGRLLGLPVILIVWSILHMALIISFATAATAVAILAERRFRPRVENSIAKLPCVHISDLHVTANNERAIEDHGLSIDALLNQLQSKVAAATGPIALTGDITDAGTRAQWFSAIAAIESGRASSSKTFPILLVPGNHDLFPYMAEFRPLFSALGLGSPLVPLRKIRFLEAAARLCPQLHVGDEPNILLVDRLLGNSDKIQAFVAGDRSLKKVVDDLWESCFPLHCCLGGQAFVILDTNRPAISFVTAAFGEVATSVWNRLEFILTRLYKRPQLEVVVLGHHHLYTPLTKRSLWRVKWLEIVCQRDLLKLLSIHADFYLHGHRHLEFSCKVGRLSIASAPSLRDAPTGAAEVVTCAQ